MSRPVVPSSADVCVWMRAGVVSYRLCDRAFDCDHCPLDAALRGVGPPVESRGRPTREPVFPDDRGYTARHLWVATSGNGPARLGIDAFAAALLPPLRAVSGDSRRSRGSGEPCCALELDGGRIQLRAPLAGDARVNAGLADDPGLVARDCYGTGWVAEFPAEPRQGPPGLLTASHIRAQTSDDLLHFRRRVALAVLGERSGVGATLPDGGEMLVDLHAVLGERGYVELLREFIG